MKNRTVSAHRVWGVQEKLRQIAELKLAELLRREQELLAEESELLRYIGGDGLFAGVLSSNLARRLRKNSQSLQETRRIQKLQEKLLLDRAARAKVSERVVELLGREARREEEKRDLGEIIEGLLSRSTASFP